MATSLNNNYRLEYTRYRHYFHQIWTMSQKPQTKVSLALLLTIFTIIIFALFAIRPTLTTVAELINKIDEQEATLVKLKQKASDLSSAQQQYLEASTQIELLKKAVPEKYELQTLIKLIEATASFHDVVLKGITFGDVSYQDSQSPDTDKPKTLQISLNSSSDYEKVKNFVNDLANLERLLIINNLSLTPPKGSKGGANNSTIEFSVGADAIFMPKIFSSKPPATEASP